MKDPTEKKDRILTKLHISHNFPDTLFRTTVQKLSRIHKREQSKNNLLKLGIRTIRVRLQKGHLAGAFLHCYKFDRVW